MFLSITEIVDLLKTVPLGYKEPNDEFFEASNEQVASFRKLGAIMNDEDGPANVMQEYYCNVPGCTEFFNSAAENQAHFNNLHRYKCIECRRALPTAHLLDLHLSEQHDSFFSAKVARGETAMYRCLLEHCGECLKSPEERKDHCIKVHKFPANFRFDNFGGCIKKTGGPKTQVQPSTTSSEVVLSNVDKADTLKMTSFGHRKQKTFDLKKK